MTELIGSIPLAVGAMAMVALVSGCQGAAPPDPEAPRPISWSKVEALGGGAERALPGRVRARRRSDLAFEVPGRIAKINVDDGDRFQRGDVLAVLDRRTFELQVSEAEAQLAEAKAGLREAKDDLRRTRTLLERGAETESALVRSESAASRAESGVARAQASLEVARERLDDSVLRAPFEGRVARRRAEPEEMTTNGRVVLEVQGDNEGFEVVASVPSAWVGRLELGSTHSARILEAAQSVSARLVHLAAGPDASGSYPATFVLEDAPERTRSGLTVELELQVPEEAAEPGAESRVSIPVEAFIADGGRDLAFVFDPDSETVRAREIEVSELAGRRALVASGLKAGEIVADRGLSFLRDGQRVTRVGVGPSRYEGEKP